MLTEGDARRAFELLQESGLLAQVLPEVEQLRGVEQPPEFHPEGDVWVHTMMLLEHLPAGAAATLAWGCCCTMWASRRRFSPEPTSRATGSASTGMRRWACGSRRRSVRGCAFRTRMTAQIVALVRHHMQFGDVRR